MKKNAIEKNISIQMRFEWSEELENLTEEQTAYLFEDARRTVFDRIENYGFVSGALYAEIEDQEFHGWWSSSEQE